MKTVTLERLRELFPGASADGEASEGPRRWIVALLSVGVAFVLWFTFSMRETYTVSVEMPIQVSRVPDGQALRRRPPPAVRVQLTGEGWDLLTLSRTPPTLEVFADGDEVNLERVAAESNRIPSGVLVQNVVPSTVDLDFDERVERTLPIRLVGAVRAPRPYGLLNPPTLTPDSVRVAGARSILDGLTSWPTERFVVEGVRRSLSAVVPLNDTLDGLVTRSVPQTRVEAEVGEFTEAQRRLEVRVDGLPPGVAVRLVPARVSATFLVPTSGTYYDRALASASFYALVDYNDIVRDSSAGAVPVVPSVPPGLEIRDVRLAPQRVEYFLVQD